MFSRLPALYTVRQHVYHVPRGTFTRHSLAGTATSRNLAIGPTSKRWFSDVGIRADRDEDEADIYVPKYRRKNRVHVYTLDPTKFVECQQPAISLSKTSTPVYFPSGPVHLPYYKASASNVTTPFSKGTTGFLYYHRDADRPPLSGEVRFRITPSADPASFASGHDLMTPLRKYRPPMPWRMPLITLPRHSQHLPILRLLHKDKLIPSDVENQLISKKCVRRSQFLFQLSDPFFLRCTSQTRVNLNVVGSDYSIYPVTIQITNNRNISFKSGYITARLELSTLPEHAGRQVLVMRCLEIIEPIVGRAEDRGPLLSRAIENLKRFTVPGELVKHFGRSRKIHSNLEPWSCDMSADNKQHKMKQALSNAVLNLMNHI